MWLPGQFIVYYSLKKASFKFNFQIPKHIKPVLIESPVSSPS